MDKLRGPRINSQIKSSREFQKSSVFSSNIKINNVIVQKVGKGEILK